MGTEIVLTHEEYESFDSIDLSWIGENTKLIISPGRFIHMSVLRRWVEDEINKARQEDPLFDWRRSL